MKVILRNLLLALISITVLSACKSNGKPTFIGRTFHNITAHYNGYFNAKLKIDNTERQSQASFQDKYEDILPIFKISKEESAAKNSKSGNQPLDEAIKKASLVIQRHESSKWIDDCYFEIGRAYFYKKDYFTAAETFQFTAGRYKDNEVGDKSYIWLIKCYVLLKKYPQAESVINIALASETFPKKHLSELFASVAWYYLEKKNYPKAIEYLEKSVAIERRKNTKARYTYIIAQLYERINENGKASFRYRQVVKMNPAYELLFNAKINSARMVQTSNSNSSKLLEKDLMKMLKDAKNNEFRDQIYYSLGLIYENNEETDRAMEAYKKSTATSVNNLNQKGISYTKLANLYYSTEDYEHAQMFYDSASTFLSKTHQDYEFVAKRKNSLSKLVENLRIIKREDSLLRLSRMPESERILFVEKVIKKEKEEKLRKQEEERLLAEQVANNLSRANDNSNNNTTTNTNTTTGSIWYFYNQNSIGIGNADFVKKFGRRTLEDNWRRSNKESFASLNSSLEENSSAESSNSSTGNASDDESLKKKYLSNIPTSPSAIASSTDKIVKAYYNIGQFYRQEIINLKESVKAYETCVAQYPDNKLMPEIYFNLFIVYKEMNNIKLSDLYKNKILSEYPNSIIAKVILDPSFISESKALENEAQKFYTPIYEHYKSGNYNNVLSYKNSIDSNYSKTSIAPKYYYIYSLSKNKLNGINAFEDALQELLRRYPSSDAANMAREHLKKIEETKNPALKKEREEDPVNFEIEKRAKYYVMISTDLSSLRETKASILRFNNMEFSLSELRINSELIGEKEQLLLIGFFNDPLAAREYLTSLNKKLSEVVKLKPGTYALSFISEKNLTILKESKSIKKYLQFYSANYLGDE